MKFKRKLVRESDTTPRPRLDSQSSRHAYEPYSRDSEVIKKSTGFRPNWITAAAAIPLVAAVIYFSTDPRPPSPTVERVENQSEIQSMDVQTNDPKTAGTLTPRGLNAPVAQDLAPINHLDERTTNVMSDLRDEFNQSKAQTDRALAKEAGPAKAENTDWSVEGFDQESLDILAKNTKVWARMSALDLDKQEIAHAKHMVKTFKLSDSGQILPGVAGRGTNNRAPSSEGKTCSLAPPRSPDPKCRANYPCRICGGCCCMCEAVLSGLAMNLGDR